MFLTLIIGRLYYENLYHLAIVLESHEHRSSFWESESEYPVIILIHAWLWNDFLAIAVYHIR